MDFVFGRPMQTRPLMAGNFRLGQITCCKPNPAIGGYTCYNSRGEPIWNSSGTNAPVPHSCPPGFGEGSASQGPPPPAPAAAPGPQVPPTCPPGQFWDGVQCRGAVGTIPPGTGIPTIPTMQMPTAQPVMAPPPPPPPAPNQAQISPAQGAQAAPPPPTLPPPMPTGVPPGPIVSLPPAGQVTYPIQNMWFPEGLEPPPIRPVLDTSSQPIMAPVPVTVPVPAPMPTVPPPAPVYQPGQPIPVTDWFGLCFEKYRR